MKIGIDLGGTKTEGILIDDVGKELSRTRIKTEKNYDGTIQGIISIVKKFESDFGNSTSVGIGMPGAVSSDSALVKNANSIWLNGKPFRKDLEKELDRKVHLENDANCFALAEAKLGAGKNSNLVFGVIMGTGVGGGIIIDGKIHHGRTNIAGEWGHHCLHPEGNICYCGKKGCVETYISGPALEKKWSNLTNQNQPLSEIIKSTDNPNFPKWKKSFLDDFGLSLANVIDIWIQM